MTIVRRVVATCAATALLMVPCSISGEIAAQLRRVVSVAAFVTGGDGRAENPWTSPSGTAGLEEAIDALGPEGGTVLLPPGYFESTVAISIPSRVSIRGSGPGLTTIRRKAGTITNAAPVYLNSVIRIAPCHDPSTSEGWYDWSTGRTASDVEIADLTIDGNFALQSVDRPGAQAYGVSAGLWTPLHTFGGYDGLRVENVEVTNTGGSGIYVASFRNVVIARSVFHRVGLSRFPDSKNAITLACQDYPLNRACSNGWGAHAVVTQNRFFEIGNAVARGAECIATLNASAIEISNNDISGCDYGVELGGDVPIPATDLVIRDNAIHDLSNVHAQDIGIAGSPTGGASIRSLVVAGNLFSTIRNSAIHLAAVRDAAILDNLFIGIGAGTPRTSLILLSGSTPPCSSVRIANNDVRNDPDSEVEHIVLLQGCSRCQVTDNFISRLGRGTHGITFSMDTSNSFISGNLLACTKSSSSTAAVLLGEKTFGIRVRTNRFDGCSRPAENRASNATNQLEP